MDGVKMALALGQQKNDIGSWASMPEILESRQNEFQATIFAWPCSFGLPSHALVITWRGVVPWWDAIT